MTNQELFKDLLNIVNLNTTAIENHNGQIRAMSEILKAMVIKIEELGTDIENHRRHD